MIQRATADAECAAQTWETIGELLERPFARTNLPIPKLVDLDALATFVNTWLTNENHLLLNTVFFGNSFTPWSQEETKRATSTLKKELPK